MSTATSPKKQFSHRRLLRPAAHRRHPLHHRPELRKRNRSSGVFILSSKQRREQAIDRLHDPSWEGEGAAVVQRDLLADLHGLQKVVPDGQHRRVPAEPDAVLELKVAKEDLGKVIGKQGRTARAMRTILGAASTKARKRSVLEILE